MPNFINALEQSSPPMERYRPILIILLLIIIIIIIIVSAARAPDVHRGAPVAALPLPGAPEPTSAVQCGDRDHAFGAVADGPDVGRCRGSWVPRLDWADVAVARREDKEVRRTHEPATCKAHYVSRGTCLQERACYNIRDTGGAVHLGELARTSRPQYCPCWAWQIPVTWM